MVTARQNCSCEKVATQDAARTSECFSRCLWTWTCLAHQTRCWQAMRSQAGLLPEDSEPKKAIVIAMWYCRSFFGRMWDNVIKRGSWHDFHLWKAAVRAIRDGNTRSYSTSAKEPALSKVRGTIDRGAMYGMIALVMGICTTTGDRSIPTSCTSTLATWWTSG